jgi:hypothetical protein
MRIRGSDRQQETHVENEKPGRVGMRDVLRIDIAKMHAANTAKGVDANAGARVLLRLKKEYHGEYLTRVFYCPPLPLLWGFAPGDGGNASVVHRAYSRELWGERGFAGWLGVYAMFLLWAPIVSGTIIWFTALNGAAIRKQTGKRLLRQAWEQLRIAARHGILPPWYYMFELFDDARLARAGQYLRRDETKGGIYRLLRTPARGLSLKDKVVFADRCHDQGVSTPPYLLAKEGHVTTPDGSVPTLPRDLLSLTNQAIVTGDNFDDQVSNDPDTGAGLDPTATPLENEPLDRCERTLDTCDEDRSDLEAALELCEAELAALEGDEDADGVLDLVDRCGESGAGEEVDALGCSLAQFCHGAGVEGGWFGCWLADWKNDEPIRPRDCRRVRSGCAPSVERRLPSRSAYGSGGRRFGR